MRFKKSSSHRKNFRFHFTLLTNTHTHTQPATHPKSYTRPWTYKHDKWLYVSKQNQFIAVFWLGMRQRARKNWERTSTESEEERESNFPNNVTHYKYYIHVYEWMYKRTHNIFSRMAEWYLLYTNILLLLIRLFVFWDYWKCKEIHPLFDFAADSHRGLVVITIIKIMMVATTYSCVPSERTGAGGKSAIGGLFSFHETFADGHSDE